MKKYIKKLLIFTVVFCALLFSILIYRVGRTHNISWQLPENTHILFLGASHIQHGINDSIYSGSINLAEGSERYLFTYLKLKNILAHNSNIDTIFVEFAPTDIWENTDTKYYAKNEMSKFLPLYFPLFSMEEWKIYANMDRSQVVSLLLQKSLKDIPNNIYSFGNYMPLDKILDAVDNQYQMPIALEEGNEINYKYLNKIIDLCNSREIKLFFLYMPMYNPEAFYDQEYFYSAYRKYFSEVELLDYSKWDCPDSLRADEHHLNFVGANIFTKELYHDLYKD